MTRIILLTTIVVAIAGSAASAATPVMWKGAMQFVRQTSQCTRSFFDKSLTGRSEYRPRLKSGDPHSSFTHYLGNNHALLVINASASKQFNGSGNYSVSGISDLAEPTGTVTGTYSFTQTPAKIISTTDFVTLDGQLDNYANIAGCSLTFRGIYVRIP